MFDFNLGPNEEFGFLFSFYSKVLCAGAGLTFRQQAKLMSLICNNRDAYLVICRVYLNCQCLVLI